MKETVGFLELGMRWKLPSKSYHIKMRHSSFSSLVVYHFIIFLYFKKFIKPFNNFVFRIYLERLQKRGKTDNQGQTVLLFEIGMHKPSFYHWNVIHSNTTEQSSLFFGTHLSWSKWIIALLWFCIQGVWKYSKTVGDKAEAIRAQEK